MDAGGESRGQWSSKIGFIFAAAGSAIGLGNIWRFPYMAGENGGAAFVFVYLLCVGLICLPYLFSELALGRYTQKNPVGAMRAIRGKSPWLILGGIGVLTGFFILTFYAVIAGWTFGYIFKILVHGSASFDAFISNAGLSISLTAVFILFTVGVVYGGVQNGIERWSKLLMPLLLIILVVLIIRSVTLPGSAPGLEFLMKPDFSKINESVVLNALGQAFFSLSLGMGLMITYGSYLSKDDNMVTSGVWVAAFDTLIALLAGLMIFPAIFAFGKDPAAGPTLVFQVLPEIFEEMPLGNFVGAGFFLLLSIAALTSTISMLEVPVAYLVDEKGKRRKTIVWIMGALTLLVSVPSALSQGSGAVPFLANLPLVHTDFLSLMNTIWGTLSLAIGALLICIFVGWVWGIDKAAAELQAGSPIMSANFPFTSIPNVRIWAVFVRYICPVVIGIVLLNAIGLL